MANGALGYLPLALPKPTRLNLGMHDWPALNPRRGHSRLSQTWRTEELPGLGRPPSQTCPLPCQPKET